MRLHFDVDTAHITHAASGALARTHEFDAAVVRAGVHEREIDPEAIEPLLT